MAEPKPQPKILLHKPKKSQRSPRVSLPLDSPAASFSRHAGEGNGASNQNGSSATSTVPPPKQPIWHRFRTALTTLLVLNAVIVGYTLFRTSSKPSELAEEGQTDTEPTEEKENTQKVEAEKTGLTNNVLPELPKVMHEMPILQQALKPELSSEEQQEIFKWMLAERRNIKPSSNAEKARLDAEKALLKEYLRNKSVLTK